MIRSRYVRYCTSSEVRDYWRNKVDGKADEKMVAVHGSRCATTRLILILIVSAMDSVVKYNTTFLSIPVRRLQIFFNTEEENVLTVIFNLRSKNESRLTKSPVCLSVCLSVRPPLTTFEPLGKS
jgi:hypothetical protein